MQDLKKIKKKLASSVSEYENDISSKEITRSSNACHCFCCSMTRIISFFDSPTKFFFLSLFYFEKILINL